jgi:hypothetical protein
VGKRGHSKSRRLYCLLWKGNEKHDMGTGFFVHHRTVSAVKTVKFVVIGCVVLRGRWCNIIVLNVHAASEEGSNDSKHTL